MDKNNYNKYFFGIVGILFLFMSQSYSSSGNPLDLFYVTVGIFFLLPVFFIGNKYFSRILSIVVMCLIIISGLILIYTYLFKPLYVHNGDYYASIGVFIVYLILFVYYYPRKWKGFLPNI